MGKRSFQVREIAAQALAEGEPPAEAAAMSGVCTKTIYRWLAEDDFRLLVARIAEEFMEQTFALRVEAARRASRRLLRLLGVKNSKLAIKAVGIALANIDGLHAEVKRRRRNLEPRPVYTKEENEELCRHLAGLNGRQPAEDT